MNLFFVTYYLSRERREQTEEEEEEEEDEEEEEEGRGEEKPVGESPLPLQLIRKSLMFHRM